MAHSRAEESVYVITFFGLFKGKGNGDPEAPKLRSDYSAETLREEEIHAIKCHLGNINTT